jgi:hypothetical protein
MFLVERYTPSLGHQQVATAVGRLSALAAPEASHVWTVLIPGEDTCLSLFTAASAAAVAEANRRAGFGFTRIIPAVAFASPGKDTP